MKRIALTLFASALVLCACAPAGPVRYPAARWVRDLDREPIPMPPVDIARIEMSAVESEACGQLRGVMTASEAVGAGVTAIASGGREEALNVNNFDEAPDSSWFTNRLGRHGIPAGEILRRRRGDAWRPPAPPLRVLAASRQGSVPRLMAVDAGGRRYLLRFEHHGLRGLSLGAEMLSSMLLYVAGYNTPANRIVEIDSRRLSLADGAKIRGRYGEMEEMTAQDLRGFMDNVTGGGPGRAYAVAVEFPDGVYVGPFSYSGRRRKDRNDRIPHQHRRELRGLRMFFALLNITSASSSGTADIFVHTGMGRGFLEHHIFDFSSAFGGSGRWGALPEPSEFAADDYGRAIADAFTLGLRREDEDGDGDEFGFLRADNFDPAGWRPEVSNEAFVWMTGRDAFWAARIIMRLADADIDHMVAASGIRDRRMARYVSRSLKARRDRIGAFGFSVVNPLDDFSLSRGRGAATLSFRDLAADHGMARAADTVYRASLVSRMGRATLLPHSEFTGTRFTLPREAVEQMDPKRSYVLRVETKRQGERWWSQPVDIFVRMEADGLKILGIQRRYDRR